MLNGLPVAPDGQAEVGLDRRRTGDHVDLETGLDDTDVAGDLPDDGMGSLSHGLLERIARIVNGAADVVGRIDVDGINRRLEIPAKNPLPPGWHYRRHGCRRRGRPWL